METDDRKEQCFIELLHKAILTKWSLNVAASEENMEQCVVYRGRQMRVGGRKSSCEKHIKKRKTENRSKVEKAALRDV